MQSPFVVSSPLLLQVPPPEDCAERSAMGDTIQIHYTVGERGGVGDDGAGLPARKGKPHEHVSSCACREVSPAPAGGV